MHMDNYKENNALSNLKMGTSEENADGNAVQITIQHADGTEVATTYRSESEAARRVGIHLSTVHREQKTSTTRLAAQVLDESRDQVRGDRSAATRDEFLCKFSSNFFLY